MDSSKSEIKKHPKDKNTYITCISDNSTKKSLSVNPLFFHTQHNSRDEKIKNKNTVFVTDYLSFIYEVDIGFFCILGYFYHIIVVYIGQLSLLFTSSCNNGL